MPDYGNECPRDDYAYGKPWNMCRNAWETAAPSLEYANPCLATAANDICEKQRKKNMSNEE